MESLRTTLEKEPRIISPCLVVVTGISATGKSTVMRELSLLIPNSLLLDKDIVNASLLQVPVKRLHLVPNFPTNNPKIQQTPSGEMAQIPFYSDYYGTHVRDQSNLAMAAIAAFNIRLNKVPIIDCFSVPRIQDGTVANFMSSEVFGTYPRYHIHFIAEEEDCFKRTIDRAKQDPGANERDKDKISSREAFHKFITLDQPMIPPELDRSKTLVINTSLASAHDCALACLDYIEQPTSV